MKMKNSTLNCFGPLSHEETILFNRKEAWNKEDALDEKYIEYLMPTSTRYFSRLRPLFSFEVKTLSSLNNFSHVLFRDGILFLLRFFIRFKEPVGLRCKILIHEDLAAIVPKNWKEHVFFYRLSSRSEEKSPVTEVIVDISPDTYEGLDTLALEMSKLRTTYGNNVNFKVLASFNTLRGEDYLDYCRNHSFEALGLVKEELGGQFRGILSLQEFWSKSFSQVELYHCNGSRVFNMDSFFTHHCLSNGGSVLGVKEKGINAQQVDLSPHHSMTITDQAAAPNEAVSRFLYEELNYPLADLFCHEPTDVRGVEDYFKVFYYSKDLLKLSRYINSFLLN
jgi:hypothetical protein